MNHENKVLTCVDQSEHTGLVTDYAAWAAIRLGALLKPSQAVRSFGVCLYICS
jgi:hypothetical protein